MRSLVARGRGKKGRRHTPFDAVFAHPGAGAFNTEAARGLTRVRSLTALFLGLIRSVLAVLHRVAHLGAVDALSVLAQELQGSLTFGSCGGKKTNRKQSGFKMVEI